MLMFFMVDSSLKNAYIFVGLVLFYFCDYIVEYLTGKVKPWNIIADVRIADRYGIAFTGTDC